MRWLFSFFSFAGSSAHKNDATGNGRPAPLLAEPRYGAAPQPYGKCSPRPPPHPSFLSLIVKLSELIEKTDGPSNEDGVRYFSPGWETRGKRLNPRNCIAVVIRDRSFRTVDSHFTGGGGGAEEDEFE